MYIIDIYGVAWFPNGLLRCTLPYVHTYLRRRWQQAKASHEWHH